MNEFEVFLDALFDETIVRLAYHATEIQTRIDSFIILQSQTLTTAQLQALISGGSTTVLAEVDAMRRAIVSVLSTTVTETAQTAFQDEQKKQNPDDQLYNWIAESGACPDCSGRSSQGAFTMDYWAAVGLPGTGSTICGNHCRCHLNPTGK